MDSELIVVVNQGEDAVLLRRLLSRALHLSASFYSGRGASLVTLARNLLVHEGGPVLVVIDTNTSHPDTVDEIRGTARFAVRLLADDSAFHLHGFVPQLEVIFYEAPGVLARRFHREIAGMELELGLLDPRRQLDRLLAGNGTDRPAFYRALTDDDLDEVLRGEQMKTLIHEADALVTRFGAVQTC
jgi:hypothetical protein